MFFTMLVIVFREKIPAASIFLTLNMKEFSCQQFNINLRHSTVYDVVIIHTARVAKSQLTFKTNVISSPLCNTCQQQL